MDIRTKIVATVGPASCDPAVLSEMVRAGADVFRINFSHGDEASRAQALADIRQVEQQAGEPLGIMADLCGPKIRVGKIDGDSCQLRRGSRIVIQREPLAGNSEAISTTLAELIDNVDVDQTLLLDQGAIRLCVRELDRPDRVVCEVTQGGVLASGKGVHLPETELKLPALTEKDRRDLEWIGRQDFDFVALSFVQRAGDIEELRLLLDADVSMVAKIEKPQALAQIERIVAVSDVIMVARGDLGVEMPLQQIPLAQKRLVRLCAESGRPCIVATQMLESMTHSPVPTRAEAADIANAVLDGADAMMLSGETAIGSFPVRAVATMNDIAAAAEAHEAAHPSPVPVESQTSPTSAALAAAARTVIERESIAAAAAFTGTGMTAALLSKQRLPVPLLAMSQSRRVVRQMSLLFGVQAVMEPAPEHTREILATAERHLKAKGLAKAGDKVVVLSGRPIGQAGATNTLVVHTVT